MSRRNRRPEIDAVRSLLLELMRPWPLFQEGYELFALPLENGDWSLGYHPPGGAASWPRDSTWWDANIIKGKFYLLHIQIEEEHRGKGHGYHLYKIMETMGKLLGCSQLRQHPSGYTYTGETRRDYLLRDGYLADADGIEVYKELTSA